MQVQSQVGQQQNSDGLSQQISRTAREGEMVVTELQDKCYEKNVRGGMFGTFINALTLLATHVSPIAAATGTPIVSIYNPAGSGKNISITKVKQATTSGTPGGPLLWNIIPNPQNITQTPGSPVSQVINGAVASIAKVFNNLALTASTIGTAWETEGGDAAVAAGAGVYSTIELHDGDIIIPPGSMLALAATAVGTSHVLSVAILWKEVAI
jgi:hypothetical protein